VVEDPEGDVELPLPGVVESEPLTPAPDWPLMLPEVPDELPVRLRLERDFDVVELVVLPLLFWSIVVLDCPV
jgi:hypothetical protein